MEGAKSEVMQHVNGLAPVKTVRGKLQRNKLVVVGLGGPAGAGKTQLAGWLQADADALVSPLRNPSGAINRRNGLDIF
jgi:ABC-type branched-subunit amino acid transport system ATPase component